MEETSEEPTIANEDDGLLLAGTNSLAEGRRGSRCMVIRAQGGAVIFDDVVATGSEAASTTPAAWWPFPESGD